MSDQLRGALKRLSKARKLEALSSLGKGEILFHRNGKHLERNFIRRPFKWILPKAGLRDIRFHDIRHTYASPLLSNGHSPVFVKEQMGHYSINVTVNLCDHLIPSSNREVANRLDTAAPKPLEIATED
jgi:integrase